MFSVECIEVLGTSLGTDTYIKTYVSHLTDGFVHNQLMKFCMNTHAQFMSANITLPPQEFLIGGSPTCRYGYNCENFGQICCDISFPGLGGLFTPESLM